MSDLDAIPEPDLGVVGGNPADNDRMWVEPVSLPRREESMLDKVKGLWAIVEQVVNELIVAAEAIYGPGSGADKKAYVKGKVLELLKKLEDSHDYLPGAVQGLVFTAISWALDFVIERVFRELSSKGVVNVPA